MTGFPATSTRPLSYFPGAGGPVTCHINRKEHLMHLDPGDYQQTYDFDDTPDPNFRPTSDDATLVRSAVAAHPEWADEQMAVWLNRLLKGTKTFTASDVASHR